MVVNLLFYKVKNISNCFKTYAITTFIIFLFYSQCSSSPKIVCIPNGRHLGYSPLYSTSAYSKLVEELVRKGYDVQEPASTKDIENYDYVICALVRTKFEDIQHILNGHSKIPPEKLMLIITEPEFNWFFRKDKTGHVYFGKILTLLDNLVDNKKYFKTFYPISFLGIEKGAIPFKEKKLAVLISILGRGSHANLYNLSYCERQNVVEFYEHLKDNVFDLYGKKGWESKGYKNYKGFAADKIETLKHYKFCYCYENSSSPGYITEKIFHCFMAGCVPIYWGPSNITDYIPATCFIDRRLFNGTKEVHEFIQNMPESIYQEYLNAIEYYLKNDPRAQFFSHDNFAKIVIETAQL